MRLPVPGRVGIILFLLIGMFIAVAGCSESFASYDILVSRFDAGGHNLWSTKIGNEKQDFATAIIETSDNGYALAGWVADGARGPAHPRVIRLDPSGRILWDRALDSSEAEAVSIAEAYDDGFVVAQFINPVDPGNLTKIDNHGNPVWNRTFGYTLRSVIPTRDGGFACAGSHTFGINGNGTLVWDFPEASTSILQASDGGFFVERSGQPENYGTLFRLDTNRTRVWTQPVGSHAMGKITSIHETPEGSVEVVYTYEDPTKHKDITIFMESEQITFGKNGNVSGTKPMIAVDPLTHTSDGGYAFEAYPFPGLTAFTTIPYTNLNLHLVRLSWDGTIAWDKSFDLGPMASAESVIQTRDGGFVTIVLTGK